MEKIKDIVLVGFAIVGFVSVLSSFSEQQVYGTPESHVWELQTDGLSKMSINKVTGEVRSYRDIVESHRVVGLREYKVVPKASGQSE